MTGAQPPQSSGPSVAAAARTSALLSVLFLVVYGGCNWITAQRADVGTWYFAWESYIPFVPLMIVPYMSIDLFFVAAPFVCRSAAERQTLARRISFAIVCAGAFFLLMPLRFAFARPHTGGWLGGVFDGFRLLDQPYNLFPSLHITLQLILLAVYARHTRGWVQGAVVCWFLLIGFSTVLTYQHHVMDVLGGLVLAVGCFYLFRESAVRLPVVANNRVGIRYALGAAAVLGIAVLGWPWGALLLWPAAALAIAATAYWGVGPGIYRKSDGRLPLSAHLVLGPLLLGQWASLLHYRRRCRPWDEVVPGLWIGRVLSDAEAAEAVRLGVTAVLDLTAEFSEAAPFGALNYRHLPVLDLTAPTAAQLREAVAFITEQSATGTVYVHCKIGYSRSAAVVGAYLLSSGTAATLQDALRLLRQARPTIVVRPEAQEAIGAFEQGPRKFSATLASTSIGAGSEP